VLLRKPDDAKYSIFRVYDIVDHGKWSVRPKPESVEFIQTVRDPSSGYGYLYRKIVRLVPGKPQMIIEHHLTNIGKRSIATSVYDHNFWFLIDKPSDPISPLLCHSNSPRGTCELCIRCRRWKDDPLCQRNGRPHLFGVNIEVSGKPQKI